MFPASTKVIPYNDDIEIRVLGQDEAKVLVFINAKNVTNRAQAATWMPKLEAAAKTIAPMLKDALDADANLGCTRMKDENLANPDGAGLTIALAKRQATPQAAGKAVEGLIEFMMQGRNVQAPDDLKPDAIISFP
jgi:hypothetical protein